VIAELGLAALWLAAALAALQLLAGALGTAGKGQGLASLVRPAAIVQGALALFSFAALVLLFIRTDLSVLLVATNSHSAKPLIFKIAGAWGNHEGSMLLWVTVMGLAGAFVAMVDRRLPERTMLATLAAQAFVRISASPSIHPLFTSAMSAFRWLSVSRSGRCSRARSARPLPARCVPGCLAHGFS
jgi:cytochrome c-type biogenesis protein CcmF